MELRALVVFTMVAGVTGYHLAPPESACDAMTPSHDSSAQTATNPYQIVLSKTAYSPSEPVQVSLQGLTAGTMFRGFMIQPRLAANPSEYTTYGTFASQTGVGNPCSSSSKVAAAHSGTGTVDKTSVNLTWTAPSSDVGSIVFVYTVVQNKQTYWVKKESSTLTYQAGSGTQGPTAAPTTTVSGSSNGKIARPAECGKVHSCFHDGCKGGNCGFMLTWEESGDDILFSLACKRPLDAYCAIGLSNDEKMGDDSVFECVANGDQVNVYVSYNSGRSNSRLDPPQFGLSSVTTSSKDGVITCSFKRRKVAPSNTGRKKRASASPSTFFDLNNDYTLFYAYGSASSGSLMQHSVTPLVSDQVADFQRIQEIGGSSLGGNLVKAHGILMVIAWMLLASFGMFSARHYKDVWPEGFEWCSQKRWFVIHRTCMGTVFLLTVVSFVIIFVYVQGYSEIPGSFEKSHPVLGIIVMALTLTNPIMALFRPHPGTPKRPIFNVAHTLVGYIAHVCSIVNLFSGTALAASKTPNYVKTVLYVYIAWLFVIDMVCHIYRCYKQPAVKDETWELNNVSGGNNGGNDSASSQGVKRFKVWVLFIQGVGLSGLSLAVIIIVAMGNNENI